MISFSFPRALQIGTMRGSWCVMEYGRARLHRVKLCRDHSKVLKPEPVEAKKFPAKSLLFS
jgi:hypothetical protein